tara:strand:+ start:113 stop:349 length:237 start_codon:yes stop_codon:yes gene_type:complete
MTLDINDKFAIGQAMEAFARNMCPQEPQLEPHELQDVWDRIEEPRLQDIVIRQKEAALREKIKPQVNLENIARNYPGA